ncbi:protein adenylyltransferase SelO [Micrococcus porci]|uniref:protein adenylyltransferase SelO n=1 Tax=Micrococcus porci TaxID=2856555 RepID=UPI003CF2F543
MPFPALQHRFADRLPELAVPWQARPAPAPTLAALNAPLAAELGLDPAWLATDTGLAFLTGAEPGPGAQPVAQVYAGHQFGSYSPLLGDGRALLLGELTAPDGTLHDVHLKGSGLTPFSREDSDGLAAVGPMLRELVVSEALHALGIPTTRALAVVATGRTVRRQTALPGAVLARVADSHLRVGTFQYAAALTQQGHVPEDLVPRLVAESLSRHHPDRAGAEAPALALLEAVVAAQADLVARWMLVGFVHGVMNTDNMTISGQSIDFGPCAFLDAFDPRAVFSSIDRQGRYAYGNQPPIALWNLNRLAEALLPHLAADPNEAVAAATAALEGFAPAFDDAWQSGLAAKLGVPRTPASDDVATRLLGLLAEARADWTAFWTDLADTAEGAPEGAEGEEPGAVVTRLLPGTDRPEEAAAWLADWRALAPDAALMRRTNPMRIPRNRPLQDALDAAEAGDLGPVEEILAAVREPFTPRPGAEHLERPTPEDEDARPFVTFCGT